MFLLVQPSGGKLWRFKYRIDGKEKKLGLGTYPEVSLAAARAARDDARKQLAAGADPSFEKKRAKVRAQASAANKFGDIAREYVEKRTKEGWAEATVAKAEWLFEHFGGNLSRYPVTEIEPADVLAVLRGVEAKGNLETARRLLQFASRVFRHAVATARLGSDPTRDLKGALTAPQPKHHAAIVQPARVGELLRAIEGYEGNYITKYALELAPHVFVRPGELRQATWSEFDFGEAVWTIPAGRMKMRKSHTVPLSRQSVALLKGLREIRGDRPGYVFRSMRTSSRPISENTLNAALRRLGFARLETGAD
ncbi:MAG: hypothetical protein BGP16_15320 [Sphingobium sp. 66-54]|nr:MAG: hypothetical protein BGP16_15320 [Sphingobium sp. 66-54]